MLGLRPQAPKGPWPLSAPRNLCERNPDEMVCTAAMGVMSEGGVRGDTGAQRGSQGLRTKLRLSAPHGAPRDLICLFVLGASYEVMEPQWLPGAQAGPSRELGRR